MFTYDYTEYGEKSQTAERDFSSKITFPLQVKIGRAILKKNTTGGFSDEKPYPFIAYLAW